MNPENTDTQQVEVTLKQGDILNFKYNTSLEKAAQVIAFLTKEGALEGRVTTMPMLPQGVASSHKNAVGSPIEAMRQSGAQTYPQKIAALGQFLVSRDSRETFDVKEVLSLLRRMGDTPRNFTRDLRNAELLGYVTKEQNGEYILTDRAAEAVETQFLNAIPASSTVKRKKGKKSMGKDEQL